MSLVTHRISHGTYFLVASGFVVLAMLVTLASEDLIGLFAIAALPFLLVAAILLKDRPFELCLGFVILSFFRIPEAFPVLLPFHIPQLLAIMTLGSLAWHYWGTHLIKPFWSPELLLFLAFFILCTIGLVFASDRPTAIHFWSETYVKIAIMTFATAWLTRDPKQFSTASRLIVFAGLAITAVTLYNKANGIGLVEETRVTIGRDIGSALGDPNDLSLVLLFPMGFACSLLLTTGLPRWQRLLGLIAAPAILAAIVATQSRGGLLGAAAVFAVFGRYKIRSNLVLVVIAAIGVLGLYAVAGISDRVSGGAAEAGIDASADGRLYAWGAAFRMALSHPITGVGLDNFLANYWAYSNLHDGHNHAVHSTWFGVLAETGFTGLVIFLTMIGLALRSAIVSARVLQRNHAPPTTIAIGRGLVAGLIGSMVSGSFLTQGFTWAFYIQIALIVALRAYADNAAWIEHGAPRAPARPNSGTPGSVAPDAARPALTGLGGSALQ